MSDQDKDLEQEIIEKNRQTMPRIRTKTRRMATKISAISAAGRRAKRAK